MTASPERTLFDLLEESEQEAPAAALPAPPRRHRTRVTEMLNAAVQDIPPSHDRGTDSARRSASKRDAEIACLVPLAQSLAIAAGAEGITVADIREAAVREQVLTGQERGRELSYLPAVPKRAGLVATELLRRSPIEKTHGNRNVVYLHPQFADQ